MSMSRWRTEGEISPHNNSEEVLTRDYANEKNKKNKNYIYIYKERNGTTVNPGIK